MSLNQDTYMWFIKHIYDSIHRKNHEIIAHKFVSINFTIADIIVQKNTESWTMVPLLDKPNITMKNDNRSQLLCDCTPSKSKISVTRGK
jgi:hypothetical protein